MLLAYAEAMKAVAKEFPQDLDVQTLYAEALMNLHAWKLWTAEGKPAPGTEQIVATLESVLARDPQHPGANHYYVHTMEASPHPEKAVASAERLRELMPSAGHLVHMPAHIMQRIGRYEEAAEANRRGARGGPVLPRAHAAAGLLPGDVQRAQLSVSGRLGRDGGAPGRDHRRGRQFAPGGLGSDADRHARHRLVRRRAVHRTRPLRPMGRDPRPRRAQPESGRPHRRLPVRTRPGACRARPAR